MRKSRFFRAAVLLAAVLLLFPLFLAGCGRGEKKGQGELVVLCGNSFVKPFNELAAAFTRETGIAVVSTVAGSEDFLPLVKEGRKGDILVTHDPYLDYVTEAGALAGHVEVGDLAPVIAVAKGNPKNVKSLADLARPGLRVALSNPEYSTCGEMVARLLEKKGLKKKVMANVGNRLTKGHSTLGTFLKTGAVDAVIMWNGVAHSFGDAVDVVPVPYEYDTTIRVHVIGLNYSPHPGLVLKFLEFARKKGPAVFKEHGYVKWDAPPIEEGGDGTDRPGEGGSAANELLLYCGAGIRPPVAELVKTFEDETGLDLAVDYAGSEVLLSRIRISQKGDLYMPGDKHYVDQAAAEGMILSRRTVTWFVPVILVAKGNPKKIHGLKDLVAPGVRLGLGDARACAIGRKCKKIFAKKGISWKDVERALAYQSLTVNELGLQIRAGTLDAVIVWDAIARPYEGECEIVPIPAKENIVSTVDLGILSFTRNRGASKRFAAFAASEQGRAIFRKHGYRTDPPGKGEGNR